MTPDHERKGGDTGTLFPHPIHEKGGQRIRKLKGQDKDENRAEPLFPRPSYKIGGQRTKEQHQQRRHQRGGRHLIIQQDIQMQQQQAPEPLFSPGKEQQGARIRGQMRLHHKYRYQQEKMERNPRYRHPRHPHRQRQ